MGLRSASQLALVAATAVAATSIAHEPAVAHASMPSCDTVQNGYQCNNSISHFWGQYSPYFTVPSDIPPSIPVGCQITFAQVLSRHGARDPTSSKTTQYAALVDRIHTAATSYGPGYEFIRTYNYTLGADQLTPFGEQEMVNSGEKFYQRYLPLTTAATPFFRSSGEDRVVESAQNFTQGFHSARLSTQHFDQASFPYSILVIPETDTENNTLSTSTCPTFSSSPGTAAQKQYLATFITPIVNRLNSNLPGVRFTSTDAVSFMDLCPFNTVAADSNGNSPSQFCALFSSQEWQMYAYYQSLGKWYGHGPGNTLGATQGAGFAAELLARMTYNRTYVQSANSYTSVNHTLDDSPATFPLGPQTPLFADFSHDNDITGILTALGVFNATTDSIRQLSNTTLQDEAATKGYSAGWTVPFASRAYFEKMVCPATGVPEELVRVVVNDRVVPLTGCGADRLGRCRLSEFVSSQGFTTSGGQWGRCHA